MVAIKISKNLRIAGLENCMREVRLLEKVGGTQTNNQSRVIKLLRWFKFRQHVFLVFELLGHDLYREIKLR